MTPDQTSHDPQVLLHHIEQHGPEAIAAWANSLRKVPLATAVGEVRDFVRQLLGRELPPARLLDIIEAMRPGIHQTHPGRDSVPRQQDALLYLQLLTEESRVYERLMHLTDEKEMHILSLAVHRNLAALIDRQVLYYLNYLPIPEREWLHTHRLFYIAVERKIGGFAAIDKIHFLGKQLSILNLYCLSLLLGCGRLNHLPPTEIQRVRTALQDWCTLVGITRKPSTSDNQLVVDITAGCAPNFRKLFSPGETTVSCYLQVDLLIEKLDHLIDSEQQKTIANSNQPPPVFGVAVQTLDATVLRHLKSAWSEYIYREQRVETDEVIEVCRGFENIFFHLAGNQNLKDFIGEKVSLSVVYDDAEDVGTISQRRSGDIWSAFLSAPDGTLVTGDIPAEFSFQHHFHSEQPEKAEPAYPVDSIRMTDTSSRGCRLLWPGDSAAVPAVGELVALRRHPSQADWEIGEIAWKHVSEQGEITTGVRLLSTRAIPVAVDVPLRLGHSENYTCGLLLPPEDHLGTRDTVFATVPLALHPGEYIAISQKGIEEKIRLERELKRTALMESYECAFVVRPALH